METITIQITETGKIIVWDGRMKNACLRYHAPGLQIYVKGKVSVPMRDKVNYHAFEACRARHIALISLRKEGWV